VAFDRDCCVIMSMTQSHRLIDLESYSIVMIIILITFTDYSLFLVLVLLISH